jgi:hypothetical protein
MNKNRTPEELAEDYFRSEEFKKQLEIINNESVQHILYGSTNELLKREYLDFDSIIERYNLSEKEIEDLSKLRK